MAGERSKKERLISIKPSGKKDESIVDLIYDLVRQIPRGRVTTYGAIAAVLNIPNPRMVGKAMHSGTDDIPAHRVINSTGHLSGEHTALRRRMLEKEGVKVKGEKIVEFKALFWDPAKEL